jgi:hypothetical protein
MMTRIKQIAAERDKAIVEARDMPALEAPKPDAAE